MIGGVETGTGGRIRSASARTILSKTSGFIAEAGFSHSLTPARNCTYGCLYCYVPTMRIQGGLRREDWTHWGQFTTFKENAADLMRREVRAGQRIYCSPLTDPYQPAEIEQRLMPGVLDALCARPPAVFVIQTRGPGILRDLDILCDLAARTTLRVSFSITTDDEDVRRRYEPHCEPIEERLQTMRRLRAAGIAVHATLAPLLPCNPERLAEMALAATALDVIGDPLHVRSVKRSGGTTRDAAARLAVKRGEAEWFEPSFQNEVVERIREAVERAGRRFGVGSPGFAWLAENEPPG